MTDDWSNLPLASALQWVVDHIEHFDPFVDPHPNIIQAAQRASELAVTLYCGTSLDNEHITGHEAKISGFLQRIVGEPAFTDRLLRSPGGLVLLLYIHAALARHSKSEPDLRELLQRAVTAGYLEQDERPPHRTMDLRLALEWGDLRGDLPSWEALCAESILARPLRVPFVSVGAAYAYTHAFFFAFGFGTSRDPRGTWFDAAEARATLSSQLVTFCQERDWDIVGELLLCWECAGLEETALSRRAWRTFLGRQDTTGAFSGPERRGQSHGGSEDADRHYFLRRYHTTLVAIMALARRQANLAHPSRPAPIAADGQPAVAALPVEADLTHSLQRGTGWLHDLIAGPLQSLTWTRRDALCRLLAAAWICDEVAEGNHDAREVVRDVTAALASVDVDDDGWSAVPAGLKLLCAVLASSSGGPVPALEGFLEQARLALLDEPPGSAEDDLPLSDKRTLLHLLGLLPGPPRQVLGDVVAFSDTVRLEDLEGLLSPAERVDAWSGFGTRAIEPPDQVESIVELLEGAAMHCLREHDLIRAARFIRAMSRLGSHGRLTAASCCRFLLLHQQPSGRLGAFGPETSDLARSVSGFSPELDLDLPVTFECIWTLAEVMGHPWNLYSAVARLRETTSSAPVPSVAD